MDTGDSTDEYFKSYEDLEVHRLMLEDKPRTLAYKNAIFACSDKFQNKIVMDVGAGTGILSVFCAKAGAAKVYAIEASHMAQVAKEVVRENGFESIIEVIHSKVEDLKSDDIGKVDIIVSEWMGFHLMHEGMLDSVLVARDQFLKENGLMFPNEAKLYASPCELPTVYDFWNDVYGVSMEFVSREQRRLKSKKPNISSLEANNLLTDGKLLVWLDLSTATMPELLCLGGESTVVPCNRNGIYQGICVWFSVTFPDGSELSTSPEYESTHWKQSIVVLPHDIPVTKDEPVAFKLELRKDSLKPRIYNVEYTQLDPENVEHDIPCHCYMTKCLVIKAYLSEHPEEDIQGRET
ncbi:protein arginine N-methyltransferase 6 [Neodiprion lecontei]|uniref:type I protein arginine methyltransferase n=1 Tax=Neodiprion lecontei TaxID=441921 RepID=A0A6J0BGY4_NEOLC|nr:protein arginine N-methyltransferase 6 [Neodiprion lecontei]